MQRVECLSCLPSVVKNLNYRTVWCRLRVEGKSGAERRVLIVPALFSEKFELHCVVQVAGGGEGGAEGGVLIMPALSDEKLNYCVVQVAGGG